MAMMSCDFEQDFGVFGGKEYGEMKLKVKASAADGLAQTLGGLWNSGDGLKIRLSGGQYEDNNDCLSAVAATDGSADVVFECNMPSYRDSDDAYMYFSADGEFSSTGYVKSISSAQSGRLDDVLDNVLYYSWIRRDAIKTASDGKSVELGVDMTPMAAVLKINVPEELQARNVRIKASSPIAGTLAVHPQKGWGSFGENALLDVQGQSDEIIIGSDGPVSGDVYVVVMPDAFDAVSDAYCSSVQTVTFSCDYYEGDLAKRYVFNDCLACGSVTDLGTIPMPAPKIPVEGGTIFMMSDAALTIGIADANPDCEYYYELGTSAETCPTPTSESTKFDPEVGFTPQITGHFDRYYIKILAHPLDTDYKGVVLTASLRHWKFDQTCPTAAVYREAATLLAQNPSEVQTEDGLYVRRRATAALNYTESAGSIEFNNCIVPFMLVEQTADVYMYLQTSDIYNVASQRTINLFNIKNGATSVGRVNEFNGFPTKTQILRPADEKASKVSVVWNLGNVAAGYKLAFAPDGKNTYYAQAILEVL